MSMLLSASLVLLVFCLGHNIGAAKFWGQYDGFNAIGAALRWRCEQGDVFESHELDGLFAWLFERYGLDWNMPEWFMRTFYVAKVIICILMGWMDYTPPHDVEVGAWDIRPYQGEYTGDDWTSLSVGSGFFKGWSYYIGRDSSV